MRINTKTGDVNIGIKVDLRDVWVGVFWSRSKSIESAYRVLNVYVCLVPCLPIHFCLSSGWKATVNDGN